jgi:hypothetical protein
MSAPDSERPWISATQTPGPNETNHAEPVADEPLDGVASDTQLDSDKGRSYEAIEESSSQDGSDLEKPSQRPTAVQRSQSNWTIATETSVATELDHTQHTTPPRKRKWSEKLNPLKSKVSPPVPKQRHPSREQRAGFFSVLTFQWISPLMHVGYQRPLEPNDIWVVNPDRSVDTMKRKLLQALEKRRGRTDYFPPLAMALYDTFPAEFWIGGICQGIGAVLQVMSPFTMKYLIAFAGRAYAAQVTGTPAPHIAEGIGLVLGITAMQITQSMCINHFIYRGMLLGGECRSVLISVIFEKAMRISGRAKAGGQAVNQEPQKPDLEPGSKEEKAYFKKKLKEDKKRKGGKAGVSGDGQGWGNGRIVNLMSTDTYRIDQACGMGHMIWTSPMQIFLTLALLCINLTYSALAGFAFICLMMPMLARALKSLMSRRKVINQITDQRVSLTQEIVSSVRFVKFFGWETSFLKRVGEIRDREINKVSFLLSIRNGIMAGKQNFSLNQLSACPGGTQMMFLPSRFLASCMLFLYCLNPDADFFLSSRHVDSYLCEYAGLYHLLHHPTRLKPSTGLFISRSLQRPSDTAEPPSNGARSSR